MTSLCSSVVKSCNGQLWGPCLVRTLYDHWSWLYVIYMFSAWEVRRLAWILWWKAPVLSLQYHHFIRSLIAYPV